MKNKEVWGIILLFSAIRLVLISVMGLMPQDAYYTYYSSNLALSYFDHPPMVAYMIKGFIFLFGKSAFALHIGDFIVTSTSLWICYLIAKELIDKEKVKIAMLLLITAPIFTIMCLCTTPDVPLFFFWAISVFVTIKALKSDKFWFWLLGGLLAGLSFSSKYTAVFIPAGLFCYLLISPKEWKKIFSWRFLIFVLMFIVGACPVIIWNIQNEFISLRYQGAARATEAAEFEIKFSNFFGFLATQLLLALPLLFIPLFISVYKIFKKLILRQSLDFMQRFSAAFVFPLLLSFTALSFIYWIKINWLIPIYVVAAVLAVDYVKNIKWLRWQIAFSVFIHIFIFVELVWMPIKINSDDTWFGWKELANEVKTRKTEVPDYFIFSDDLYKTSAALNFYLDEHIYAGNVIESFAYQFALNDSNLDHLLGKNALCITSSKSKRNSPYYEPIEEVLGYYFEEVTLQDSILIKDRRNVVQRRFAVYKCKNYHGYQ